ncbi:MAG: hypothetical protein QMC81_04635 [Thermoanaerobacterales bacterium]|nr:hypothetical protein [Bacillota bacterium]MDI6906763.1 hypothetical protein [Thermoanaerobacterales bacterium]
MPKLNEILARLLGEGQRRQQILVLLALGVLGLVLLSVGSAGGGGGGQPGADAGTPRPEEGMPVTRSAALKTRAEEEYLAARLESMLSQVAGAGAVDVTVKLEGSSVLEYATSGSVNRRVTEETDRDGGRRVITEDNLDDQVVVVQAGGGQQQQAVVEREVAPRVTGVLVVAEGARDPQVRMELFRATRAALGVEPHLIEIMPRKF